MHYHNMQSARQHEQVAMLLQDVAAVLLRRTTALQLCDVACPALCTDLGWEVCGPHVNGDGLLFLLEKGFANELWQ